MSWFPIKPDGFMATVTGFVYMVTDFAVLPLRRVLPMPRIGAVRLDLSIICVLMIIQIARRNLC